ncbi:hypothetical protein PR048_003322 [Dryococelus australis]|uniref:Uncharacterized protein n=1 Tax=Dryococelus australis TaxID=614101 RepID=A0ABQ9IMS3_9NEOP|nr:hypothetical protein PR048_003322 [Dryococelus australis]
MSSWKRFRNFRLPAQGENPSFEKFPSWFIQEAIARAYDEDGDDPCSSSSSVSTPTVTIASFFKKQKLYDPESHRKIELDRNLALMVACDIQPFSIVEDKGFRAFFKSLDPKYELPSKTTLRN